MPASLSPTTTERVWANVNEPEIRRKPSMSTCSIHTEDHVPSFERAEARLESKLGESLSFCACSVLDSFLQSRQAARLGPYGLPTRRCRVSARFGQRAEARHSAARAARTLRSGQRCSPDRSRPRDGGGGSVRGGLVSKSSPRDVRLGARPAAGAVHLPISKRFSLTSKSTVTSPSTTSTRATQCLPSSPHPSGSGEPG